MFRSARVLVVAIVVAVSLLGSASVASADTSPVRIVVKAPLPAPRPVHLLDISWE